jgi:hypothetical protein
MAASQLGFFQRHAAVHLYVANLIGAGLDAWHTGDSEAQRWGRLAQLQWAPGAPGWPRVIPRPTIE